MFKPTVGLLAALDGPGCRRCGSIDRQTIEHVIPRSRGGPDILSNCVILCRTHNLQKAANIPSYSDLPWERMLEHEAEEMRVAMRRYLSWWTTTGAPRLILDFISGSPMPILAVT